MKIEINKEQYRRVICKLLDSLYGPKFSYKRENDTIAILSNEGNEIFRVYTNAGKGKGCERDMYVPSSTEEEINDFIPKAATRKKLFAKTIVYYVNEKTNLNIDCIEFWYEKGPSHDKRYNFSVKKNKKIKKTTN